MIRFGLLGTARIAGAFLGYPLRNVEISAIASRDLARASAFANQWNLTSRYGSYDELIADPAIDAVYVPLPPHLHCEYALKAAGAGKHILMEKPLAASAAEAVAMSDAAEQGNVFLMEALMYRFMKIHNRVKEIVGSGMIGELRYIDFNFCFEIIGRGRTGYRTRPEAGGGALLDLGIYAVDFIRFITDMRPVLIEAFTRKDEVDMFTHAVYEAGRTFVSVTCSFNTDANYYVVSGSEGSVTSLVAISGRSLKNVLHIHMLDGDKKSVEEFLPENPYKAEIEYFAHCIEKGERPFPDPAHSLVNLQMLDELRHRARNLT